MMSLLFVVSSIGQIIGPVISSVITVGTAENCTACGEYFALDEWNFECCALQNLNVAVAIAVGILSIATVYTGILLFVFKVPSLERRLTEIRNNSINDEESRPIYTTNYPSSQPHYAQH